MASSLAPGSSPQPHLVHPLSDIFPDSPPLTPSTLNHLPSDIPRLHAYHSTAGYRNGISTAKTSSLQPGFDEGYSLGAVIGLRVGYILGVLEGFYLAFDSTNPSERLTIKKEEEEEDLTAAAGADNEKDTERKRLLALLLTAKRELAIENVFGKEWWAEDGTWLFEVEVEGEGDIGKKDVTFFEVCDRHPLLERWSGIVCVEMARVGAQDWGLGEGGGGEEDGTTLNL